MSVDAGLNLFFQKGSDVESILRYLLDAGWRGVNESALEVTSLEDDEGTISIPLSLLARACPALDLRLTSGEAFAITMLWGSSGRGGEFIFSSRDHVQLSATIERITLGDRVTDVSWYLSRILVQPKRSATALSVESWKWLEIG